jgi:hypothetical protein
MQDLEIVMNAEEPAGDKSGNKESKPLLGLPLNKTGWNY